MSKKEFIDDGRQVADMSGTVNSWYGARWAKRKKKSQSAPLDKDGKPIEIKKEPISKAELRSMTFNAILAALAIALVFIGGAFLFIQFCLLVWLK